MTTRVGLMRLGARSRRIQERNEAYDKVLGVELVGH